MECFFSQNQQTTRPEWGGVIIQSPSFEERFREAIS